MDEHLFNKFPAILKDALIANKISFPDDIIITFDPIWAYRVVPKRANYKFCIDDFQSQIEVNYYRNCRALKGIDDKDIKKYSCSLFTEIEKLENIMHMPRKNKIIIEGNVTCENGIIQYDPVTTHIHWWLYENRNIINDFKVIINEN